MTFSIHWNQIAKSPNFSPKAYFGIITESSADMKAQGSKKPRVIIMKSTISSVPNRAVVGKPLIVSTDVIVIIVIPKTPKIFCFAIRGCLTKI